MRGGKIDDVEHDLRGVGGRRWLRLLRCRLRGSWGLRFLLCSFTFTALSILFKSSLLQQMHCGVFVEFWKEGTNERLQCV